MLYHSSNHDSRIINIYTIVFFVAIFLTFLQPSYNKFDNTTQGHLMKKTLLSLLTTSILMSTSFAASAEDPTAAKAPEAAEKQAPLEIRHPQQQCRGCSIPSLRWDAKTQRLIGSEIKIIPHCTNFQNKLETITITICSDTPDKITFSAHFF